MPYSLVTLLGALAASGSCLGWYDACSLVLTTSIGVTRNAARVPPTKPEKKTAANGVDPSAEEENIFFMDAEDWKKIMENGMSLRLRCANQQRKRMQTQHQRLCKGENGIQQLTWTK
jgi:hypothetical protein